MKQVVRKIIKESNQVEENKSEYSAIIDGNNLLKISLVNKELKNDRGECYGAVYNFLKALGDLLAKKDFNYCICCWDGQNSGVLRYNLYPDYKANRGKNYSFYAGNTTKTKYDQFIDDYCRKVIAYHQKHKKPVKRDETEEEEFNRQKFIIQSILEELSIRQYEFENVEGDDLISYYVKNKHQNEKVVIMSSDKDLTQLIKSDVCVWNPRMKKFVTDKNSVEVLGITHENIVLEKVLCGDASDNIKGIKGCGEKSLLTHFPEIKSSKTDLNAILAHCNELMEQRKVEKKKPLKLLENIQKGITDGCQGEHIYEINTAIVDLSEPLLTEECKKELDKLLYAPIDQADRKISNVYNIIHAHSMHLLEDTNRFGEIFGKFNRIIVMEGKNAKKS